MSGPDAAAEPAPDERALGRLVADSTDGVVVVDRAGIVLFANPAAERMLRGEGTPLSGGEFGIPAPAGTVVEIDVPETGAVVEMRVSDGEWGGQRAWLASLRDITDRRHDERARARLAALVEASDDAIIGLDAGGIVESWNAGAVALYGYEAAEAVGRHIDAVVAPAVARERTAAMARVLTGGCTERVETQERHRNGSTLEVAITDSPIRGPDGAVAGIARVVRDIGPRRSLERELRFFADHDALTGLFNRRRLAEELAHETAQVTRYGEAGALVVGDVDNFKLVNDALGHQGGDELLRAIAGVLRSRLRDTDLVARLGGDEFAAVLPHTDLRAARAVAESLRAGVHELETLIQGHPVRVTMSLGVTAIEGGELSPDDVLAVADLAMYEAKYRGRDHVVVTRAGHERAQAERVLSVSHRLRVALDEDRLELHRQPIVDVTDGAVDHYELLVRIREPDGALVPPGAFIRTAERYGLITEIDRWVVARAMRLLAADAGGADRYCVNLSGASIVDPALVERIVCEIERHAVDPARLIFEITETAAIGDLDAARRFATAVRAAGCASALDDFGSGFGSFTYLRHLPIDYLKIDGEFVRRLPGSQDDRLVIKAIIDIAHGLGKRTIAEHVGSEPALRLLRDLGVDFAQGFLLGRPAPVAEATTTDARVGGEG